jgi:hypothetical protein
MPQTAIRAYLEQLPALQAEWQLLLSQAAMVPYMEAPARKEFLEGLMQRRFNGERPAAPRARVNPAILASMGIKVVKS